MFGGVVPFPAVSFCNENAVKKSATATVDKLVALKQAYNILTNAMMTTEVNDEIISNANFGFNTAGVRRRRQISWSCTGTGLCYNILASGQDYNAAHATCNSMGAHLPIFSTSEEYQEFKILVNISGAGEHFRLGYHMYSGLNITAVMDHIGASWGTCGGCTGGEIYYYTPTTNAGYQPGWYYTTDATPYAITVCQKVEWSCTNTGFCYLFLGQGETYAQAQSSCNGLGGALSTFNRTEEYEDFKVLANRSVLYHHFRLGYRDESVWNITSVMTNLGESWGNATVHDVHPCLGYLKPSTGSNFEHGWYHTPCTVSWFSTVCQKATCLIPSVILNGSVTTNGTGPASTLTFSCNPGFILNGNPILTCGNETSYDYAVPTCEAVLATSTTKSVSSSTTEVTSSAATTRTTTEATIISSTLVSTNYHTTVQTQTPIVGNCTDMDAIKCLNGGICITVNYDNYCMCSSGFKGINCETPTNECETNYCHKSATCVDEYLSNSCICPAGLTGFYCENQIDYCLSNPCPIDHTCHSYKNGYTCLGSAIVMEQLTMLDKILKQTIPGYVSPLSNQVSAQQIINGTLMPIASGSLSNQHRVSDGKILQLTAIEQKLDQILEATNRIPAIEKTLKKLEALHGIRKTQEHSETIRKSLLDTTNNPPPAMTPEVLKLLVDEMSRSILLELDSDHLIKMGYSLSDMMVQCRFDSLPECLQAWDLFYHHQYGNCFTFNNNFTRQRLTTRAGVNNGLFLHLLADVSEYSGGTPSVGFRFVLHSPGVAAFPDMNGFSVVPGHYNAFSMTLTRISSLGYPYSECIRNVSDLGPEPYYYGGKYSVEGCELSYKQKLTGETCECYNPKFGRPPQPGMLNCSLVHKSCLDRVDTTSISYKHCATPCEYEDFNIVGTKSKRLQLAQVDCNKPANFRKCEIERQIATVAIYYGTLSYMKLSEVPTYTVSDLLSDFGGILGLFNGVSVITMVEFGYFIVLLIKRLVAKLFNIYIAYI